MAVLRRIFMFDVFDLCRTCENVTCIVKFLRLDLSSDAADANGRNKTLGRQVCEHCAHHVSWVTSHLRFLGDLHI